MALSIVQTTTGYHGSAIPGVVTLTSTPTVGNLIIFFLNTNITSTSLTINTTDWSVLNYSIYGNTNGSGQFILYRYVQSGDTSSLPALATAGATYHSWSAYEISGVSGNIKQDVLSSNLAQNTTASKTSIATANMYTAGTNCLALTCSAVYNLASNNSISSPWTLDAAVNNSGQWGSVACAHQTVSTDKTSVNASWTFASNSSLAMVGVVILAPATATRAIIRQSQSRTSNSSVPTPFIGGNPIVGNLLVLVLSYASTTDPTFTANWTLQNSVSTGSRKDYVFTRYVQSGDTSSLPSLATAGSNYNTISVWEISGVGSNIATTIQDIKMGFQTSGTSITTTSANTTSNDALALLQASTYGGTTNMAASGWDIYLSVNGGYGSLLTASEYVATSGTSVSASITNVTSGHTTYAQILIGGAIVSSPERITQQVLLTATDVDNLTVRTTQQELLIAADTSPSSRITQQVLLVATKKGHKVSFAQFKEPTFHDWVLHGDNVNYDSYLTTWYDIPAAIEWSQTPYSYYFLKNGDSTNRSLKVQYRWDYSRKNE